MAYTKATWTEGLAITHTRLNNLETQYDEAVAEGVNLRADNTKALRAEVAASLPAAGTAGRMIFNTTNNTLYVDDGTAWRSVGRSTIKATKRYSAEFGAAVTHLDVSIDSVNRNYSVVRVLHETSVFTSDYMSHEGFFQGYFTADNWVRLFRKTAPGASYVAHAIVEVIEFDPGVVKSLQRGNNVETSHTGNSVRNPTNVTITAVDRSKSLIFYSYQVDATGFTPALLISATLTTDTNLQFTYHSNLGAGDPSAKIAYEVVEFY